MDKKPQVINLGITSFYDALLDQDVKATNVDWHPPVKLDQSILDRLARMNRCEKFAAMVKEANEAAADAIINADPN